MDVLALTFINHTPPVIAAKGPAFQLIKGIVPCCILGMKVCVLGPCRVDFGVVIALLTLREAEIGARQLIGAGKSR